MEEENVILTCPECGAKNRLPPSRRGEAVCGRCRAPLAPEVAYAASLQEQHADAVRAMLAEGRSLRDIADKLGVTVATVDEIARELARRSET